MEMQGLGVSINITVITESVILLSVMQSDDMDKRKIITSVEIVGTRTKSYLLKLMINLQVQQG